MAICEQGYKGFRIYSSDMELVKDIHMDGYPLCSDYIPEANLYAVASTDLQISFFTDDASMRRREDLYV